MSGIRIPPAMPPAGFNLNTAMANFEEEKTFFVSMFVVIAPQTRRRLKNNRTRKDRERELSTLGRVIRRFQSGSASLRKSGQESEDSQEEVDIY